MYFFDSGGKGVWICVLASHLCEWMRSPVVVIRSIGGCPYFFFAYFDASQSPDEEMKKIVLKVVQQCVATEGVEPEYIKKEILPPFFSNFWVRRMALDRRNYRQLGLWVRGFFCQGCVFSGGGGGAHVGLVRDPAFWSQWMPRWRLPTR